MAGINGYFQILLGDGVSFVRLFPPQPGGEPIRLDEIREYLGVKGYNIDAVALKQVLDNLSAPCDFKIADKRGIPCGESMSVKIAADKMSVVCRFYPFSTAGEALTGDSIKQELAFRGVKRGIDENAIGDFLSDKKYCTDYILAKGLEPTCGEDAKIEYFFNTNPNAKPKLNEDGSVDFFDLQTICKCEAGQELARLTKEVRGDAGYNVVGDILQPREVKKLMLKYGRDIDLSEDGCTISSRVNGHVSLVDDKVFVSNVYEVVDVDTSTGNIDYQGDVLVTGNVKAGFCVEAEGNVEIRGFVEGAMINASGDVIIARGMNGMGKGIIKAGGNVVAKFFENTNVTAGGYVHAEAILHSKISAKGDVEVTGKKGFITGGVIRSLGTVSAKTIGSDMGVDTEIEVGVDPTIKNRYNALEASIAADSKKIAQIEPVILTFSKRIKSGDKLSVDQIRYFKQISTEYQQLKAKVAEDQNALFEMGDQMEETPAESVIKVSQFAYPGTKLSINDVTITLSKSVQHTRFVKEGADIRIKAL